MGLRPLPWLCARSCKAQLGYLARSRARQQDWLRVAPVVAIWEELQAAGLPRAGSVHVRSLTTLHSPALPQGQRTARTLQQGAGCRSALGLGMWSKQAGGLQLLAHDGQTDWHYGRTVSSRLEALHLSQDCAGLHAKHEGICMMTCRDADLLCQTASRVPCAMVHMHAVRD